MCVYMSYYKTSKNDKEEKERSTPGIMIMHQNFSRVSHGVKLSQQLYCRFTISIVAIDYDTGKFLIAKTISPQFGIIVVLYLH